MKKVLHVLNCEFILNSDEDIIQFVLNNIPDIKDSVLLNSYTVSYVKDEYEYKRICQELTNKNIVAFYADEKKEKYIVQDKTILVDEDSVLMNQRGTFTIIGRNEKAKRILLYLIREAVYENYILNKDLVLHSAAVELDGKGYALLGHGGAGKTTLLMELIDKLNANFITNDILAVNSKDELIASILPLRIANGSLSRMTHEKYEDAKEKNRYEIEQFINQFQCQLKTNVPLDKILLPHFVKNGSLNIQKVPFQQAYDTIIGQTMNIFDPIRPYMWVNEFKREDILKEYDIQEKIRKLIENHEVLSVEYGNSMTPKEVEKVLKLLK